MHRGVFGFLLMALAVSQVVASATHAFQDAVSAAKSTAVTGKVKEDDKSSQTVVSSQPNKDEQTLNEHLSVFAPLIGKTFRGEFENSTPEKPVVDVSTYERAMNGQAVRSFHSINDGEYGGESVFMWDAKQQKISYWYFTTAGFFTQGTLDVQGNELTSFEEVTGNANGITKVKAVTTLLEDGTFRVKSEYFANGEWTEGRNTSYKPAPGASVKFK